MFALIVLVSETGQLTLLCRKLSNYTRPKCLSVYCTNTWITCCVASLSECSRRKAQRSTGSGRRTMKPSWRSRSWNTTSASTTKRARTLLTRSAPSLAFHPPFAASVWFPNLSQCWSVFFVVFFPPGDSDVGGTWLDPFRAPVFRPAEHLIRLQDEQPPRGRSALEEAGGDHQQAGEERQQEGHEHAQWGGGEGEGSRAGWDLLSSVFSVLTESGNVESWFLVFSRPKSCGKRTQDWKHICSFIL